MQKLITKMNDLHGVFHGKNFTSMDALLDKYDWTRCWPVIEGTGPGDWIIIDIIDQDEHSLMFGVDARGDYVFDEELDVYTTKN